MDFKPILLKASLAAVLDLLSLTLRARIERNELLFHIGVIEMTFTGTHFENFLEWTHAVLTLGYVNHFVIGSCRDWLFSLRVRLLGYRIHVVLKMTSQRRLTSSVRHICSL